MSALAHIADGPLQAATPAEWVEVAIGNMDAVLLDHAHCEKKAAAAAISLVTSYPEHTELVKRCCKLAQEELRHFRQVHEKILARGLVLGHDPGDPYVQGLRKCMLTLPEARRTERLLVSALVEARSCERLALLADNLDDPDLAPLYAAFARSEAGHYRLFVDLAARYDDPGRVEARLGELAVAEAEVMLAQPVAARIH